MPDRVDTASARISAPPHRVYQAFASADALAAWLPPGGMTGTMLAFDFQEGGGYRLRLTYPEPGWGKSTANTDEVSVRFLRLVPGERIEQAVRFTSDDPAFAGEMHITWLLQADGEGTHVVVRCEDVPPGIVASDHEAGLASTLSNLASFVEQAGSSSPPGG